MKKQDLYILAFKKDPLIKVGLAGDPSLRVAALGLDRFDLSASYLVRCQDQSCIRILERNLKTFFAEHQVAPEQEMSSGNTETFSSSILGRMLQFIEMFQETFPDPRIDIERDLSFITPSRKVGARRSREELREERRREAASAVEKTRAQLDALENFLPNLRVKTIEIVEDSSRTFDFTIYLEPNQSEQLNRLWELARMRISVYTTDSTGFCHWGASMELSRGRCSCCAWRLC